MERNQFTQKPRHLQEIRTVLHERSLYAEILQATAVKLRRELEELFETTIHADPIELTPQVFATFYNPSAPTIAIDTEFAVSGKALLGLAAHEQATRANIIYIPTCGPGAHIQHSHNGQAHLALTAGIVVLEDGRVAYGELPNTLNADAFETVDGQLLQQCEAAGVKTLLSHTALQAYNDKTRLQSMATLPTIELPRRLSPQEFLASPTTNNLVVKPSKTAQGKGVLLTGPNADPAHTKQFYAFLEQNNYEPIIEERIRSWEITNPRTQERLDWNVRAVLSYGELLGMYVRMDTWGKAVNLSLSAKAVSMADFTSYFNNQEEAEVIIQRLQAAAQAIAKQHYQSVIGADLTINEAGQPCLFELNTGIVGGMQTIATLENTYDDKMALTRQFLGLLLANSTAAPKPTGAPTATQHLEPSFTTLATTMYRSSATNQLSGLNLTEIPRTPDESRGAVLAFFAIRETAYRRYDTKRQVAADHILMSDYPLEVQFYMPFIATRSYNPESFTAYMQKHSALFPEDTQMTAIQGIVAANTFNLNALRQAYPVLKQKENFSTFMQSCLARHFATITRTVTSPTRLQFADALYQCVNTYCLANYKAAQALLVNESAAAHDTPGYAQLIAALQFCLAAEAGELTDALQHFDTCKQLFEETSDFYTVIAANYTPKWGDPEFIQQPARIAFAISLAYKSGISIPTTLDAVQAAWLPATSPQIKTTILQTVANQVPATSTAQDRQHFLHALTTFFSDLPPATSTAPELTQVAALLQAIYTNNIPAAVAIIANLGQAISESDAYFIENALAEASYAVY